MVLDLGRYLRPVHRPVHRLRRPRLSEVGWVGSWSGGSGRAAYRLPVGSPSPWSDFRAAGAANDGQALHLTNLVECVPSLHHKLNRPTRRLRLDGDRTERDDDRFLPASLCVDRPVLRVAVAAAPADHRFGLAHRLGCRADRVALDGRRHAMTGVESPGSAAAMALSRRGQTALVWCGPAAVVLVAFGLVGLAHFVPPLSPNAGGEDVARFYVDNMALIRAGMMFTVIGFAFMAPFGVAVAAQTRRIEARPALCYLQLVCVAIGTLEGVLCPVIWGTAAFRPDSIDPDITRMLNDFGWFMFLFNVFPFCIWFVAIGSVILADQRARPILPRWCGYVSLWGALVFLPADLIVFFKDGPFAYNGLFALYLPAGFFFTWIIIMVPVLLRAVREESPATGQRLTEGIVVGRMTRAR